MFDIRHKNASYSIQELFQDFSEIHSYNTRSPSFSNFYKKNTQQILQKAKLFWNVLINFSVFFFTW